MNSPAASGRGIRYFIKSENLIGFPTPFPFKETPPQGAGVLKIKNRIDTFPIINY